MASIDVYITHDSWADYNNQATNYGTDATMTLWRNGVTYKISTPVLRVNLTAAVPGTINSANLYVYGYDDGGSSTTIKCRSPKNDPNWDESTVTFASINPDAWKYNGSSSGTLPNGAGNADWIVVPISSDHLNGDYPFDTYGVFLMDDNFTTTKTCYFDSSEGANPPFVRVDYTPSATAKPLFFKVI